VPLCTALNSGRTTLAGRQVPLLHRGHYRDEKSRAVHLTHWACVVTNRPLLRIELVCAPFSFSMKPEALTGTRETVLAVEERGTGYMFSMISTDALGVFMRSTRTMMPQL
jgi:hypothetical protein